MINESKQKATLADVAKLAGVSKPTVSAVLQLSKNNNSGYSQETYQRVMGIVEEVGYRPNRTASNFYARKHGSLGILINTPGFVNEKALNAILNSAIAQNLTITIDKLPEDGLPILLKEDSVDGIFIFEEMPEYVYQEIEKHKVPLVEINTNHRFKSYAVTYDEYGGIAKAILLLQKFNRRKILFPVMDTNHYSRSERWWAIQDLSADFGFDLPDMIELSAGYVFDKKIRSEAIEKLDEYFKSNRDHADAVIMNDYLTFPVYNAVYNNGMEVGQDISVIGINNSPIASSVYPELTSLAIDYHKLGSQSVDLMMKVIAGKKDFDRPKPNIVDFNIYLRTSH